MNEPLYSRSFWREGKRAPLYHFAQSETWGACHHREGEWASCQSTTAWLVDGHEKYYLPHSISRVPLGLFFFCGPGIFKKIMYIVHSFYSIVKSCNLMKGLQKMLALIQTLVLLFRIWITGNIEKRWRPWVICKFGRAWWLACLNKSTYKIWNHEVPKTRNVQQYSVLLSIAANWWCSIGSCWFGTLRYFIMVYSVSTVGSD